MVQVNAFDQLIALEVCVQAGLIDDHFHIDLLHILNHLKREEFTVEFTLNTVDGSVATHANLFHMNKVILHLCLLDIYRLSDKRLDFFERARASEVL